MHEILLERRAHIVLGTATQYTHINDSPLWVCHTMGQPIALCRSALLPPGCCTTSNDPQTSDKYNPGAATGRFSKSEKKGSGKLERGGTANSTCCASDTVVSESTALAGTVTVTLPSLVAFNVPAYLLCHTTYIDTLRRRAGRAHAHRQAVRTVILTKEQSAQWSTRVEELLVRG
eukprot:COSAG01_NODE_4660_length_4842_cov_22.777567_4_plen_175_part_00